MPLMITRRVSTSRRLSPPPHSMEGKRSGNSELAASRAIEFELRVNGGTKQRKEERVGANRRKARYRNVRSANELAARVPPCVMGIQCSPPYPPPVSHPYAC